MKKNTSNFILANFASALRSQTFFEEALSGGLSKREGSFDLFWLPMFCFLRTWIGSKTASIVSFASGIARLEV